MENIQRMAPDGSPLAHLAQQGAEVENLVVAEKSASVPRGEPSTGATIGQGVPKVKPHPQPVQISIYPSTMCAGASHITTMCGNMVVIGMTSATSLKIRGASETEHQVHHHSS
jgi:hypothetical protein